MPSSLIKFSKVTLNTVTGKNFESKHSMNECQKLNIFFTVGAVL